MQKPQVYYFYNHPKAAIFIEEYLDTKIEIYSDHYTISEFRFKIYFDGRIITENESDKDEGLKLILAINGFIPLSLGESLSFTINKESYGRI